MRPTLQSQSNIPPDCGANQKQIALTPLLPPRENGGTLLLPNPAFICLRESVYYNSTEEAIREEVFFMHFTKRTVRSIWTLHKFVMFFHWLTRIHQTSKKRFAFVKMPKSSYLPTTEALFASFFLNIAKDVPRFQFISDRISNNKNLIFPEWIGKEIHSLLPHLWRNLSQ